MVGTFINDVLNSARLAALRRLGLLDTPAEAAFDRLGTLASQVLNAPVALVTLVDDTRQFFKSCIGLPEPWATWRNTPLSHSFCQHVLKSQEPLVINDARTHPIFADNLGMRDLHVIAYLGIPLRLHTGEVLGSFCVIDHQSRIWSSENVEVMSTLAVSVITEIELRGEIRDRRIALEEVEKLNLELKEKSVALQAANKELEAFSHSVSHDLSAPLRSLIGFSQALTEDCANDLSPQCRDYLARMSGSAERMQHIMEGLACLFGVKKSKLDLTEVDLSAIAEEIVTELKSGTPERQVTIKIEPRLVVKADAKLMAVALENLLRNAWKFSSKTPHATIELGAIGEGNQKTYFVRDTGAGFDAAHAGKLFAPFQRLHGKEFEGTGIGLATVKHIIERHNGRIWASGEPGKGATFWFVVPG